MDRKGKQMKRIIYCSSVLMFIALSMNGCGAKTSTQEPSTKGGAETNTVILNEEVFEALTPYGEELEPVTVEEPEVEVVKDQIVTKRRKR